MSLNNHFNSFNSFHQPNRLSDDERFFIHYPFIHYPFIHYPFIHYPFIHYPFIHYPFIHYSKAGILALVIG